MIFLVGARRSGTNWLQRIVNAHPDVVGVPSETYLFSRAIRPLTERFQHGAAGSLSLGVIYMERRAFLDALRDFCDAIFLGLLDALGPGAARLTERTPEHTTSLDLINDIYPDARIVHIIRDGRDVVRSLASQHWGPGSIRQAAEEWKESVEKARADGGSSESYLEVRYEALLAEPRTEIRRMYEHLDLEVNDEILDAALIEANVLFNLDPGYASVGVGKWVDRFSTADLAEFNSVAGPLLGELGYAEVAPGPAGEEVDDNGRSPAAPIPKVRRLRQVAGQLVRVGRKDGWARIADEAIFGAQTLADKFLGAMSIRRWSDMEPLLDPSVFVGIHGGDVEWRGRGGSALAALQAAVVDDVAFDGRQVRGDVYPAPSVMTVVATYEVDGRLHDRMFVLTVEGDRIIRVAYYRFPLGTGTS